MKAWPMVVLGDVIQHRKAFITIDDTYPCAEHRQLATRHAWIHEAGCLDVEAPFGQSHQYLVRDVAGHLCIDQRCVERWVEPVDAFGHPPRGQGYPGGGEVDSRHAIASL